MATGAVSAEQLKALREQVNATGIESNIERARLLGKIASIGTTYSIDTFQADVAKAAEYAIVENVYNARVNNATNQSLITQANPPTPDNIDPSILESKILENATGNVDVPADIQAKVKSKAIQHLAGMHADSIINGAQNIEQYLQTLQTRHTAAYRPDLADSIRQQARDLVDKRVEEYKAQLEAGTLTEAQLLTMIAPGGTITNPELINSIKTKITETPEKIEAAKKRTEQTNIETDAGTFAANFNTTPITADTAIDFANLSSQISSTPEFASLPGPIQALIKAQLKTKSDSIKNKREQADIKDEIQDLSVREKKVERNQKYAQLVLRNLGWVALGAGAAGGIGLLLGNPQLAWMSAIVGGVGAFGLSQAFDKQLATLSKEALEAKLKIQEEIGKKGGLETARLQGEIAGIKEYTTLAALIDSLAHGYDKAKAIEIFLKTAHVNTLEEIMKI